MAFVKDGDYARTLIRLLAGAKLIAFILPVLMIILIVGTIAEKTLGLYRAQEIFFSSWIIWLGGFLPLPGLLTLALIIFTGLLCKLALDRWEWSKLGTIAAHIGVAVLLLGGFVTAQFSREGAMVIPPGASRDYMEDYHQIELAITDVTDSAHPTDIVISEVRLKAGAVLTGPGLPFEIEVMSLCRNCGLVRLDKAVTEGSPHGVAINFILKDMPRNPVEEQNFSGLTFRLHKTVDRDGLYAIFESMPIPEIMTIDGRKYLFTMRHARTRLPFSVKLVHFTKDMYPGTRKPRAYESEVVVEDGDIVWHSLIGMNEPLRYRGYTLYQSSFIEGQSETATVLAVVKNAGRMFPYLSGIMIAAGLLIHLVQSIIRRRPARSGR